MRSAGVIAGFAALYATWRAWLWLLDRVQGRRVPELPCDGTPLTEDEYGQWQQIEQGYEQAAGEPR
jgi:hypothetical protein